MLEDAAHARYKRIERTRYSLPEVRLQEGHHIIIPLLEEVLVQLSPLDVVLFHERNTSLLECLFDAQLLLGIVPGSQHLLVIDLPQEKQVSIILRTTLRRIVPEVLLLHLGQRLLMPLLSLLIFLLMLTLIGKKLVLQRTLRLKLLLGTLLI